jgi:dUTP pyrophosphatase
MSVVYFQRLDPRAKAPTRATSGSAGWDLYALVDLADGLVVPAMDRAMVSTGIAIELPMHWLALALPRSGLACKYGVTLANSPGLIDSDYRGEIGVYLENHSDTAWIVRDGDRIAQMLPMPAPSVGVLFKETDDLVETARGARGFGSTGL